jgi:lycopene cyclase domain-containing protein
METGEFHTLYLLVDLAVLALPFLLSFDKKIAFHREWKYFFPVNFAVGAFFIAWDVLFARAGIWAFNPNYLLGPKLLGLPIEEWLFFICIPYACVFTYFALRALVKRNPLKNAATALNSVGIVICFLLVLIFRNQWYIAVTSSLTFFGLLWMAKYYKPWSADLWLAFFVLLFPFILSNGVLTGIDFQSYPLLHSDASIIRDQIVWYHPGHNTGWRIFSMPADDLVYGFLLIGMHVAGIEGLKMRALRKSQLA